MSPDIFTKRKELVVKNTMADRLEDKFVNNCRAILETMRDACGDVANPPVDPGVFRLIDTALNVVDPTSMIRYYATETHKYWDQIKMHDEGFICSNVDIILNSVNMNEETRKIVKGIINNEKMTRVVKLMKDADAKLKVQGYEDDDLAINYIWKAMEALVRLSIKYVIRERSKDPNALPRATYNLASMQAQWL